MVNLDEIKTNLKIEYPCLWEYKIILDKNTNVDDFFKSLNIEYKSLSNSKDTKNYKSYNLTIQVNSEANRLELFSLLRKNAKYVL